MKTSELYSSVTERIIQELKEGVPIWVKPWSGQSKGVSLLPGNVVSGRPYSGINVLILWAHALDKGYPTHGWATFQQANQIGASVRKGEKASQVVFVKRMEKEEDGVTKKSTMLKTYPVFNIAQLDNVPPHYSEPPPALEEEVTYDNALQLVKDAGMKVTHGGNTAAFYPSRDEIVMPPYGSFKTEVDYWNTMWHEGIHWTGAKKRLERTFGKRFGDKAYSFEELVAELGSAFICARLGIQAGFRSASYIDHWLKILEGDDKAIFTAASYASQAANYIFEQSLAVQDDTPAVEKQPANDMADAIPY
jgi:antirestriction protein ArdC